MSSMHSLRQFGKYINGRAEELIYNIKNDTFVPQKYLQSEEFGFDS